MHIDMYLLFDVVLDLALGPEVVDHLLAPGRSALRRYRFPLLYTVLLEGLYEPCRENCCIRISLREYTSHVGKMAALHRDRAPLLLATQREYTIACGNIRVTTQHIRGIMALRLPRILSGSSCAVAVYGFT